jgi:hypothetical protein
LLCLCLMPEINLDPNLNQLLPLLFIANELIRL